MIKKYKQLIIGVVIGMLIASIPTAMAATKKTVKSAKFNEYTIKINGKQLNMDYPFLNVQTAEDKGSKVFAPIRPIIEEMGGKLTVDDKTETYNVTIEKEEPKMSINALEYDTKTGLPVSATYSEYKGCKTAVLYKNNIYLSSADLYKYLGFKYKDTNAKDESTTYENGDSSVVIKLDQSSNYFFDRNGTIYLNINLF